MLISLLKKEFENEMAKRKPHTGAPEAEEEYVANHKPELETPWEMTVAEMSAERLINSKSTSSASSGAGGDDENNDDELIKRALDIIQNTGKVSTSLLQRKLRIGYPRAARLMEELQEMGYVGAASHQAGKGRDVNRELDEDE
jgi:DNA segregation ATPase FtsK/SpoIIIE-like protein